MISTVLHIKYKLYIEDATVPVTSLAIWRALQLGPFFQGALIQLMYLSVM